MLCFNHSSGMDEQDISNFHNQTETSSRAEVAGFVLKHKWNFMKLLITNKST